MREQHNQKYAYDDNCTTHFTRGRDTNESELWSKVKDQPRCQIAIHPRTHPRNFLSEYSNGISHVLKGLSRGYSYIYRPCTAARHLDLQYILIREHSIGVFEDFRGLSRGYLYICRLRAAAGYLDLQCINEKRLLSEVKDQPRCLKAIHPQYHA